MDYHIFEQRVHNIVERMVAIGGEVSAVDIGAPATLQQIAHCENQLGFQIPKSFKKCYWSFHQHYTSVGFFQMITN